MNSFGKYIIVSLMLLFTFQLSAQPSKKPLHTKSSKAIKHYEKAITAVEEQNYQNAIVLLDAALSIDPNFIDALAVRGDCYMFSGNCKMALESYYQALKIDPDYYPPLLYLTGLQEYQCGKYKEAVEHFQAYIEHPKASQGKVRDVNDYLANAKYALEMMKYPVKYNPINMGPEINDTTDEYLPSLTADEQEFVFTVRRLSDEYTVGYGTKEEDFYCSVKDSTGKWKPRKFMNEVNSHYNEGAQSLSPDGKYLIFTLCNRSDGYGDCDLYWSKRIGNRWSRPRNCGRPVNTDRWESQPSFASDGKTIYFASSRYGSTGSSDIWKTEMIDNGTFTTPENLGNVINTKGEEVSPYLHPDNQTLYFASTGHGGFGGRDLFMSKRDSIGNWGAPKNLGYPINTAGDEIDLFVNAAGTKGYLASQREGGYGGLDLYWFELDESIKPIPVNYFKGNVFDENTHGPLEADVELVDLQTGKTFIKTNTDPLTGNFLICLPTNHDYLLNVSHPDYLFYSDHFSIEGTYDKSNPFIKDVPLKTFKIGETVVLKNVFFDTDKFILKDESKIELDRLVDLLKKNSRIKIEIGGHTDNQGSKEHNITLSQNRSNAVMQYLVNHGIDKTRLTCKGYGMSTPIATNENEAGRALNRRTEFKIIGF